MVNINGLEKGTRVKIEGSSPQWLIGLTGTVVSDKSGGDYRVKLDHDQTETARTNANRYGYSQGMAERQYHDWLGDQYAVFVDDVSVVTDEVAKDADVLTYSAEELVAAVAQARRETALAVRSELTTAHAIWKDQALNTLLNYAASDGLDEGFDEALREAGFEIERTRTVRVTLELELEIRPVALGGSEDLEEKVANALSHETIYQFGSWIQEVEVID